MEYEPYIRRKPEKPKEGEPFYDFYLEREPHKWYPDAAFLKQYEGPLMIYNGSENYWKWDKWNVEVDFPDMVPIEKSVKNLRINFGPQHPAAHGVLRLVLELQGEVSGAYLDGRFRQFACPPDLKKRFLIRRGVFVRW